MKTVIVFRFARPVLWKATHGSREIACLRNHRLLTTASSSNAVDEVLSAVKAGDTRLTANLLPGMSNIDATDRRGWSALMLASYIGLKDIVDLFLTHGADPGKSNFTGQNSIELALFGSHLPVAKLLKAHSQGNEAKKSKEAQTQFFDHNPLIRMSEKRNNDAWLLSALKEKNLCKFIVLHRLRPLVVKTSVPVGVGQVAMRTFTVEEIHQLIAEGRQNLIFLGCNMGSDETAATPWFAIDASESEERELVQLDTAAYLLNPYPGALVMDEEQAAILAQARGLCDWHYRYKFCPTCGSETSLMSSGYKRTCRDPTCSSHSGPFNVSYPRVDPTVIAAVISNDSKHCVLARKQSFTPGMFTCVAGYVEPGESIESACVREVHEEVGLNIESVEYVASQPWPMPNSLMMGCIAVARESSSDPIQLDEYELDEGRWFSRKEAVQMLMRTHPQKLFVPPTQAIAHTLVKIWVLRTAADFDHSP